MSLRSTLLGARQRVLGGVLVLGALLFTAVQVAATAGRGGALDREPLLSWVSLLFSVRSAVITAGLLVAGFGLAVVRGRSLFAYRIMVFVYWLVAVTLWISAIAARWQQEDTHILSLRVSIALVPIALIQALALLTPYRLRPAGRAALAASGSLFVLALGLTLFAGRAPGWLLRAIEGTKPFEPGERVKLEAISFRVEFVSPGEDWFMLPRPQNDIEGSRFAARPLYPSATLIARPTGALLQVRCSGWSFDTQKDMQAHLNAISVLGASSNWSLASESKKGDAPPVLSFTSEGAPARSLLFSWKRALGSNMVAPICSVAVLDSPGAPASEAVFTAVLASLSIHQESTEEEAAP